MTESRLQSQIEALARSRRRARMLGNLAQCWAAGALTGLALLAFGVFNWVFPTVVAASMVGVAVWRAASRRRENWWETLKQAEVADSGALELLASAAEQKPGAQGLAFLQWRVIAEAESHPAWDTWKRAARQRLHRAQAANFLSLIIFAAVVLALKHNRPVGAPTTHWLAGGDEIAVTPGDTNVERGTSLVIAARFGGTPPAEAALVLRTAAGKETRLTMARRLADPVFGTSVAEVSEAASYHIEYGGQKTRDYHVGVFEYPALTRADAALRYPGYTGLTNRTILDTRRVSAVEGTHLAYTLQLNKPAIRARWVGKKGDIAFVTSSNGTAALPDFVLTNSATYHLELVDADGRANKFPIDFVLQALTNQRPIVRLVFPRDDPRVSKVEELQLRAEASDDFGLLKYGIGYGPAGQEPKFVELGQTAPANARRPFEFLMSLEKMGVDVDQSVSYFAWADDYGPDGRERRTFSDIFFADVRPFDEVFRADQSGEEGGQSGGGGQGAGGGDERVKLAEMQKQIVIATWNLEKLGGGEGLPHP